MEMPQSIREKQVEEGTQEMCDLHGFRVTYSMVDLCWVIRFRDNPSKAPGEVCATRREVLEWLRGYDAGWMHAEAQQPAAQQRPESIGDDGSITVEEAVDDAQKP